MVLLKKEETLIERDNDGKLIPKKVRLELVDKDDVEVVVTPATRGELSELNSLTAEGKAEDAEIKFIIDHCVDPAYTKEDVERMYVKYRSAIAMAILALSTGFSQQEINIKGKQQLISETEANLKKN